VTDYTVLHAASQTMRSLLEAHITSSGEPGLGVPIDLRSPHELEKVPLTDVVSLWLFRVTVQPDMANRPPPRVAIGAHAHSPLHLDLAYLITPIHTSAETELLLAGRIAQVIWDHRRLRGGDLKASLAGTNSELLLSIDALAFQDNESLWYSHQSSYRLAIPLRVQGVAIDSHLPTFPGLPVLERVAATSQIVEVN
jgi:hypothetical protein